MEIIGWIPARSGSKSLQDKNIKELGGRPLLAWSIETSLKCGLRTIVNSDSPEYLRLAQEYGAETMLRPSTLAGDKISMLEVLQSEVRKITPKPDIVVLLQPTSPFRSKIHIKLAIDMLSKYGDRYDSVISVERVPEKYNPYAMIIQKGSEKRMLFRKLLGWKEKLNSVFTGKRYEGPSLAGYPISHRMTNRQDLPQAYLPDGALYVFKTENLKGASIYGNGVMLIESEGAPANINNAEDWEKAEKYLKEKSSKC